MRLAVTGADGMLGRRVGAAAADAGHDVLAWGRVEADVTDAAALRERVGAEAPDAVVNCAAFTDVDAAEAHEDAATRVNGEGAGHVARACAEAGARLVHVSTDYVFAGDADRPYVESDPPGPRTAYGRSKLAGEQAVAAAGGRWAIARTAWLYGAGGRNFVDTMLRLAGERDEVGVVTDQVGSPTWTGRLAPALVALAERGVTGVRHVAGEGACSWHDLAVAAFAEAGAAVTVTPTTSAAFPRPAPRPAYSVLASEHADAPRLGPWRDGLRAYLAERTVAA